MTSLAMAAGAVGVGMALFGALLAASPARARSVSRRFPRSVEAAWVLTAVDLAWSAWLLYRAPFLADMRWAQILVLVAAPVSFALLVAFLEELLAARALGGLLLLLPQWMFDAAFLSDAPWKRLVPLVAYAFVVAGIALVLSPYRFRRVLERVLATDLRSRAAGAVLAFVGLALLGLALSCY